MVKEIKNKAIADKIASTLSYYFMGKQESGQFSWPLFLLVLLSLLFIPFIYCKSAIDAALLPRLFALNILVLAFVIYYWFRFKNTEFANSIRILNDRLFFFFALLFILSLISLVNAVNPSETIAEALKFFVFFAFLMVFSITLQDKSHYYGWISKIVIIYALISFLIAVLQFIKLRQEGFPLIYKITYQIQGLSAHRNLFSQMLFLTLPFSMYGMARFRKWWFFLSMAAALLSLSTIFLLFVRSVWLALFVSFFLSFLMYVIFSTRIGKAGKLFRKTALILFLSLSVFSIFISIHKFNAIKAFANQGEWIRNYREGSSMERIDLWKRSFQMFKEQQILGVGSGNWKIHLPKYGTGNMRSAEGIIFFQRPHNDYLWILSENGLFAFLIYLAVFISVLIYIIKIMKIPPGDNIDKLFFLLIFFGLCGYLCIAFFSFPKERIEHSIYLFIFISFILVAHQKKIKSVSVISSQKMRKILGLTGIILCIALIVNGMRLYGEINNKKGLEYWTQNRNEAVITYMDKASNIFYTLDPTSAPLEWYCGVSFFNMGHLDQAYSRFLAAYNKHPFHIHVLNNLGTCYELKGDQKMAQNFYLKALSISPRFEESLLNLCASYFNTGQTDLAYEKLREIDVHSPNRRYLPSLEIVLAKIHKDLAAREKDSIQSQKITLITRYKKKIFEIHKKSVLGKEKYEKTLYDILPFFTVKNDSILVYQAF
jgi:O-antigen ligase